MENYNTEPDEFKDNEEPNVTSVSFENLINSFIYGEDMFPVVTEELNNNNIFQDSSETFRGRGIHRFNSRTNRRMTALNLLNLFNYINTTFDTEEDDINRATSESFESQPDSLVKTDKIIIISSQRYETLVDNIQEDTKECCICYEEFIKESMISITNCNHIFHTDCIKEWGRYKTECPICREKL